MPWEKTFDEDSALEVAMNVFWAKGYEEASMSDLIKVMLQVAETGKGLKNKPLRWGALLNGAKNVFQGLVSRCFCNRQASAFAHRYAGIMWPIYN